MSERDYSEPSDSYSAGEDIKKSSAKSHATSKEELHAEHMRGNHQTYDPDCDHCRRHAEEEYQQRLASGEFNRIELPD